MISHKHKVIFIHIPKTAGTSINSFFHPGITFHYANPDYERLFGWCPKRKIHMQHATVKQLLETELITKEQWQTYFKFTFVRNPWDRAYSDYFFIQKFSGVKGSFNDFISKSGPFKSILNDNSNNRFLGDHLEQQTSFFDFSGEQKVDFIGRFENFSSDIQIVLNHLNINQNFNLFLNKGEKSKKHYSLFYTKSRKEKIAELYKQDIELLNYNFEDKKSGLNLYKNLI